MYTEFNLYASLWSKYRPVILQLMVNSGKEPQQYKLSAHEFKAASQREKLGYSFSLEVSQGKATNNIKASAVAKDLLATLQQSPKASQLMQDADYELSMDKQFVLHVTRKTEVPAEV
jgi:hypothetical protein